MTSWTAPSTKSWAAPAPATPAPPLTPCQPPRQLAPASGWTGSKPMQIAMVNQVQGGDPLSFDFRVAAVNLAMVRDVASKWKGHLPGDNQEPWPCVNYRKPPADPKSVHP